MILGWLRHRLCTPLGEQPAERERRELLPHFAVVGLFVFVLVILETVFAVNFGDFANTDQRSPLTVFWLMALGVLCIQGALFTPIIYTLLSGEFPVWLCETCMVLLLPGLCMIDVRYILLSLGKPPILTTWPLAVTVLDTMLVVQCSPRVLQGARTATHLWIVGRSALVVFTNDYSVGVVFRVWVFLMLAIVSCGAVVLDHRCTTRFATGQRDLHGELTKALELSGKVSALLAQLELDEAESVLDRAVQDRAGGPAGISSPPAAQPRATQQELVDDLRTIVVHLKMVAPYLPDMVATWRRSNGRDLSPQSLHTLDLSVASSVHSRGCSTPFRLHSVPVPGNPSPAARRLSADAILRDRGAVAQDSRPPAVHLDRHPTSSSLRTLRNIIFDATDESPVLDDLHDLQEQTSLGSSDADSEGPLPPLPDPLKVSIAAPSATSRKLPRRVGLRCAPRSIVVWQMHGFLPSGEQEPGWEVTLAHRLSKASSAVLSAVFESVGRAQGEIVRFDSILCLACFRKLPAALRTAAQATDAAHMALAFSAATRGLVLATAMTHGGCFVGVVGSAARRAMALNGAPVETAVRAVLWPASIGPRPIVRASAIVCHQLKLFQDGDGFTPWVFVTSVGVSMRRRPMPADDCMFADAVFGDITGCESGAEGDIVDQINRIDRAASESPPPSEVSESAAVHACDPLSPPGDGHGGCAPGD
eukprot:TRINITY_DN1409_c0_g1_i1.p1 TRINITY_DN1409_c0_g1~~TRINITY_DN1409_c0_g1_i1.p1  ORF type:complete len:704 (+),score=163.30 TRINITY_DN1409_c0_g1_i1:84-2195(+)